MILRALLPHSLPIATLPKTLSPMKTLFTAEAISQGGRSGTLHSADCLLGVTLGNPLEPDSKWACFDKTDREIEVYVSCF
jgi:hypothetical protein